MSINILFSVFLCIILFLPSLHWNWWSEIHSCAHHSNPSHMIPSWGIKNPEKCVLWYGLTVKWASDLISTYKGRLVVDWQGPWLIELLVEIRTEHPVRHFCSDTWDFTAASTQRPWIKQTKDEDGHWFVCVVLCWCCVGWAGGRADLNWLGSLRICQIMVNTLKQFCLIKKRWLDKSLYHNKDFCVWDRETTM